MSGRWRKFKRFLVFRILHADDSPHVIAKGAAVGLFISVTPTPGFQMALALLVAAAARANKAISVAMVWFSNPVTALPITYVNWWIGHHLLNATGNGGASQARGVIEELGATLGGPSHVLAHVFDLTYWSGVLKLMWSLGLELWVGSFVLGAACALLGYFITLGLIRFYRQRLPRPRFSRRTAPSAEQAALPAARPHLRRDSGVS
jgi:uncharacterized protein (DUF2062 family)